MPGLTRDSDTELSLDDFELAGDHEEPQLVFGQAVVICAGTLQGAKGTIVKKATRGQYLVALLEQTGRIWARLPANLLKNA